uniref:Uncharacterized protein n=1 Tax=Romanomermis culicivorax TaxID=13658 RepID=A0A915KCH9_ROMCU
MKRSGSKRRATKSTAPKLTATKWRGSTTLWIT